MSNPQTMENCPLLPQYLNLSEQDLILRCQAGDLEAFNVLIQRYENRVLNIAYRYLRDYHQALDEAQEVFVKIYENIKSYRGSSAFSTWLYSVTTNQCFNALEKRKRCVNSHNAISLDEARENEMPDLEVDMKAMTPEEEIHAQERNEEIRNAIFNLPPDQQQAIILCHYEEMSYEEISEIMKLPLSTVSSCLYRARKNLKKQLASKGGDSK